MEAALAQPLAEGRPITGEVISMRQREDLPFLFDVTTELDASGKPAATDGSSRPTKVATNSYRKGWDAIWGRRGARGPLN